MMRIITVIVLLTAKLSYSQGVGIGTKTPDVSSMLDIASENKGVLVPRIKLLTSTDEQTITTPQKGLLLWNTSEDKTAFPGGPGFYFNNNTKEDPNWVKLGVSGITTVDRGLKLSSPFNCRLQDTMKGPGARFQYVYDKGGAIRAGYVNGTQWDIENIGNASAAFGVDNKANGAFSFAAGQESWANGNASFAMGPQSIAGGTGSVAFAGGKANNIIGSQAFAFGTNSTANQSMAIAMGLALTSNAYMAFATGDGNIMNAKCGFVLGSYNDTTDYSKNNQYQFSKDKNPLFVVANGLGVNNRSNALTIFRDGSATLGGVYAYKQEYPLTNPLSLVYKKYLDEWKTYKEEVSAQLDFPVTAAFMFSEHTVELPGAKNNDFVECSIDQSIRELVSGEFSYWVSAPGVVKVRYSNYTNNPQDPIAGKFIIRLKK